MPPRGERHPDFAPGNEAHLKHGSYSTAKIAERAEMVHEHLLEVAPWVDRPEFMPSVQRYCQATAREQLAHAALMAGTNPSPRLLEAVTAAARLAWAMGDALGLTPAGHAKLKMMSAGAEHAEASIADLMAQGRASRIAAEERIAAESMLAAEARFGLRPAQAAPEPLEAESGAIPPAMPPWMADGSE